MAKAKIYKKDSPDENGVVKYTFADGTERTDDPRDYPKEIRVHLEAHGSTQKHIDAFAGAGGESDPVGYAVAQFDAVTETLKKGEWSSRVPGVPRTTLVVEASARIRGTTVDAMQEFFDGLTDTQIKGIGNDPGVKKEIAAIKLERATKAADGATSIFDTMK